MEVFSRAFILRINLAGVLCKYPPTVHMRRQSPPGNHPLIWFPIYEGHFSMRRIFLDFSAIGKARIFAVVLVIGAMAGVSAHATMFPSEAFSPSIRMQSPRSDVAEDLKGECDRVGVARFTAPDYRVGTIRHLVLFRYGDEVSADQMDEVKSRFLALQQQSVRNGVPYVESIVTGWQNSGEGAAHGFEQGFIVTFRSAGDRNYYVGTPIVTDPAHIDRAHEAFKEFVAPLLRKGGDGVLIFDFMEEK